VTSQSPIQKSNCRYSAAEQDGLSGALVDPAPAAEDSPTNTAAEQSIIVRELRMAG
jgi:hypothetical protein